MANTVIIVEDIAPMRTIIRTVLKSMKIEDIIEASNGADALRILQKLFNEKHGKKVDLIICDWNMPKMTGIELLTAIRRDKNFSKLPFLMLTAQANAEHLQQAVTAGASDYVVKPFQSKILEEKVRKLISI